MQHRRPGAIHLGRASSRASASDARELENPRLHLLDVYASMFDCCTARLGMNDEVAHRRFEVARLGRRFAVSFWRITMLLLAALIVWYRFK